jgi:hypothetical protein
MIYYRHFINDLRLINIPMLGTHKPVAGLYIIYTYIYFFDVDKTLFGYNLFKSLGLYTGSYIEITLRLHIEVRAC